MTRIPLLSLLAVTLAGAAVFWFARPAPDRALPALPMAAEAQEAAGIDTSSIAEMALGPRDAAVTVIEYASFTCPHCATFHEEVFPRLKENYVDTGQVRFVHREVYFDRPGLWAGMVARCGGEERYFGIADLIYERQREWTRGEPTEVVDKLRRIGKTAGLTDEQLDTCLSDGQKAQTLVAWYQQNAEADGINATPSFIIDGEKFSNMPYADFAEILDEKLGD
ncbi:DsbA family protein [Rhodovulum sp. 12E13]|uniref:DsbA family protein n=1 Tax=Rhodovulum sp. 12E13 TaxID=2203891 RepID=UPI000E1A20A2|nr:DsbA family protein [Rhodovulum sp. 12E13]RDC69904.1 DsbA family protein [Rhodovulum sp. 12E13]